MYGYSTEDEEDRFGFRRDSRTNFGVYLLELKRDRFRKYHIKKGFHWEN